MPTIRAALEQLRAGEDITLVDMREPGQHVRVTKDGGSVVVDVTDEDETRARLHADTRDRKHHRTSGRREPRYSRLSRGGFPYWRAQQGPLHAPVRIGDFTLAESSKPLHAGMSFAKPPRSRMPLPNSIICGWPHR